MLRCNQAGQNGPEHACNVMMCSFCFANESGERGQATNARSCFLPSSFFLLLCLFWPALASRAADTNGPTIQLRFGREEATANAVADFMYFVPLISRDPVASLTSPGSTQVVHMLSTKRHFSRHSFAVTCEVELTGEGWQHSVFDFASAVRRHESHLQKDGSLGRRLKSIEVQGAGAIIVEVEGELTNEVPTVREVRLRFNAHGRPSPIWINLCELCRVNGSVESGNETIARVNTLTFRRQAGPPTMEVSIASVKHKDSGDGFWSNLKGRLAGTAVNMFLDPFTVEPAGHEAMLDFGQALVSGAPTFTFPRARNLQASVVP
jgi:hypothetical protein